MTAPGAHRYVTLDAMRGVAAVAVLMFHLRPWYSEAYGFSSGYLAVDLFFGLSGFVIAHAYEARLRSTMGFRPFVLARIIRLLPVIALGTALGAALALVKQIFDLPGAPGMKALLVSIPLNLLMLPNFFLSWGMFPFNPPAWSLFYELVANFAYAASVKWLTLWRLAVIALIGWLGVVAAVLLMGNLDNGLLPSELPIGLARVGFSFSIGLLLYRTRDRWMQRIPRITMVPALLLTALALAAPVTGGVRISYDLLFVTLIAPGLIMLGAVSVPSTRMHGFAIWLGVISYPLYAIHAPVKHWVAATISAPPLAMMVGTALVVVAASWLVARWYDPPVRDWLTNRLRKPHRADTASPSEHLPLGTERS